MELHIEVASKFHVRAPLTIQYISTGASQIVVLLKWGKNIKVLLHNHSINVMLELCPMCFWNLCVYWISIHIHTYSLLLEMSKNELCSSVFVT